MPSCSRPEFRRDVIAVARKGDASICQIARDFEIWEPCLARWLEIADRGGGSKDVSAALSRCTKQLEQGNEILRRATAYFARNVLPQ